jgi:hypothetical protein
MLFSFPYPYPYESSATMNLHMFIKDFFLLEECGLRRPSRRMDLPSAVCGGVLLTSPGAGAACIGASKRLHAECVISSTERTG